MHGGVLLSAAAAAAAMDANAKMWVPRPRPACGLYHIRHPHPTRATWQQPDPVGRKFFFPLGGQGSLLAGWERVPTSGLACRTGSTASEARVGRSPRPAVWLPTINSSAIIIILLIRRLESFLDSWFKAKIYRFSRG